MGSITAKCYDMIEDQKYREEKRMSKADYFQFAERFFNECLETSKRKNADYTGGNDDPFANFQSVEVLGISTEHGFLTRMMDKMKRIASFVEQGTLQVKDESVTDTLADLASYSCLFAGYIKSKSYANLQGNKEKENQAGVISGVTPV